MSAMRKSSTSPNAPNSFYDDHFIQYTLEITGRDREIDDEIKRLFLKEEHKHCTVYWTLYLRVPS